MENDLIQQLITITGTSEEVAKNLLEACNNDIQLAIEMHLESTDSGGLGGGSFQEHSRRETSVQSTGEGSSSVSTQVSADLDDDNIRAPIPQQRAVLVDDPYHAIPYPRSRKRVARSVFDGFRDFQAETKQQEELLRKGNSSKDSTKIKSLQDLFRPPVDITFKGTFESAKTQGEQDKKWVLVNVQNVNEFVCQTLNRDVWRNEAVREIIKGHFILWQVYCDSDEGQRYMLYYPVKSYPHIAVIDPRTGERLAIWGNTGKIDSQLFCDIATAFLSEHNDFDPCNQFELDEPRKKKQKKSGIIDATEDFQMEAAIAASLDNNQGKRGACRRKINLSDESDSDSDDLETFTGSEDEEDLSAIVDRSSQSSLAKGSPRKTKSKESKTRCNVDFLKASSEVDSKANINGSDTESQRKDEPEALNNQPEAETSEKIQKEEETDPGTTEEVTDDGPQLSFMLRLPNGNREPLKITANSSLKKLHDKVALLGYAKDEYELVSNFPRRNFSEMDQNTVLKSAGLHPQETIFVQAR